MIVRAGTKRRYVWIAASWIVGVWLLVLMPAPVSRAQEPIPELRVRSYPLNPYNSDLDGQWQASIAASDGYCYFASSTHSARKGAAFFKYDP